MSKNDKKTEIDLYEIIKTINQIATDAKDFSEPDKKCIGMKREKCCSYKIQDRRIVDGFGIKFAQKTMRINYTVFENMDDILCRKEEYEEEIFSMLENIASFIKKEYHSKTGSKLKLTRLQDEPKIFMADSGSMVNQNVRVQAFLDYKIDNKTEEDSEHFETLRQTDKYELIKEHIKKFTEDENKNYKKRVL